MNDPNQELEQLDLSPLENGIINEYSVNVSIEPNHESEILEIKYDGQEIYKEPPSYSENLAQLISKIDFSEMIEEKQTDGSKEQKKDIDKSEIMTARKFYQNIYERVKLSFDEICVLLDCLTIVKADKLMTIDHGREHLAIDDKAEVTEKTLNLLLKKKNLEKSKLLLKKSLDKISNEQELSNIKFHLELYKARQLWRIKKIGNRFNCDLSYRSVGCINSIKANLELFKVDNPHEVGSTKPTYLSVIVPEELKDYAYIQVKIIKTSKKGKKEAFFDSKFSLFTYNNNGNGPQEILEREQNSIYCKEIYNKLLREIFDPNNPSQLKPIIIGNSIQIMITMEHDLVISLVHTHDKNFSDQSCPKDYNFDNAILEYYLHCLLKKSFDQNFYHYDQKPITSTFAYNSQVKIAGMAYSNLNIDEEDSIISVPQNISHLLNKKKIINLLQSIKEKAEHLIIRKRVLKILSSISKKSAQTNLIIEQSAWNSANSTDITVTISSSYYGALAKSFFYIIIKKSQISVLNRSDNISITFTDSLEDFRDYFIDQCCFHQINLILTLCQLFGWTVLASSFTNELNKKRMTGVGLVYNNNFSKKIGIKVGPVNKIQIFVNQYNINQNGDYKNSLYSDLSFDWIFVKDNFTEIDLDSYPGFTEIQKFELCLAHFSTSEIVQQF